MYIVIVIPKKEKEIPDCNKLDEIVEEGVFAVSSEFPFEYHVREAILIRERLGHPLTDVEMKIFEKAKLDGDVE